MSAKQNPLLCNGLHLSPESCPARNRTIREFAGKQGDSELGWGDRWGTSDDLWAVIDAWPALPEAVKAEIVAMVKAAETVGG